MNKSKNTAIEYIAKNKLSLTKVALEDMPAFYGLANYKEYDLFTYSFTDDRFIGGSRYIAIPKNPEKQVIDLGVLGE